MTPPPEPIRILFVFAWLVVGGEETEVRLLARHLDRARYRIDVLPCLRRPNMPDQTHRQLAELGVHVDTTAYDLSFEDTVAYIARRLPSYDLVVSCQNVADIYPALERLAHRPPLIEHGGLVSEALAGPKHFTARYVGVCAAIRDAAASHMPGREQHALEIPSMVDLSEFRPEARAQTRAHLGLGETEVLIGWVGRLDRKKRVEDFIEAAALVTGQAPQARFVIVGGPDAFMPEYADELRGLAAGRGLDSVLSFLGDRPDVPDLLAAFDVFVWLSRGEGMPHVIAEAGAARLAAIATADNGATQQIEDGVSGLFVPHEDPPAIAAAMLRLIRDPALRHRLGAALRHTVESRFAAEVVVPRWQALIDEVLGEVAPAPPPRLFQSWYHGGWECSSHRLASGRRLDIVAATGHDRNVAADYRQLRRLGITTMRDGLRWHLIERRPGTYDFASWTPMLLAARNGGTQVIWDLLHYGWPDDIDIWTPTFVDRFAAFARAAALQLRAVSDAVPFWCPVNEISFFAWGGGDARYLNPFAAGRGFELKVQLARAAIAAMHELRRVDPRARFVHCEPAIVVHHDPVGSLPRWQAEGHHDSQFQACELLAGRLWPQIGGDPAFLDIVGVNYYFDNQWIHGGPPIDIGHPLYRPFSDILFEVYARFGRPLYVAETGTEGERRPAWLRYIARETARARTRGVPVEGICLYPIANHPGWDDDRACENGLLGSEVFAGARSLYARLAEVIRAWHMRPDDHRCRGAGETDDPLPRSLRREASPDHPADGQSMADGAGEAGHPLRYRGADALGNIRR
jgi:glycosyltransferase involved in cell wall biosynthesis